MFNWIYYKNEKITNRYLKFSIGSLIAGLRAETCLKLWDVST